LHVGVLDKQFQLNVTAFIPAFSQLVIVIKIDNPPVSCLHTYEETCRANRVLFYIIVSEHLDIFTNLFTAKSMLKSPVSTT
ncbi:hypothetical protein, partial [Bacillus wiedmannii]|uniref:hypothetical protein n=1 Tax=Bacillus wiedmannii TaxID=1890302 RepID=UPI001C558CEE